eukprot:COSAG02_NODE_250_length_27076_cov_24.440618_13_plen_99_part_00
MPSKTHTYQSRTIYGGLRVCRDRAVAEGPSKTHTYILHNNIQKITTLYRDTAVERPLQNSYLSTTQPCTQDYDFVETVVLEGGAGDRPEEAGGCRSRC